MAIENLSISDGPYAREGGVGVKIKEGSVEGDVRLVWSTTQGSEVQKSFTVTVSARGWAKGDDRQTEWKSYTAEIPAAQCNEAKPRGDAGRVWWSVKLSQIGALVAEQMGGRVTYTARVLDSIDLQAWVTANFTDAAAAEWGMAASAEAFAYLYVGYVPVYSLTRLYYDTSDRIVFEYETTWTRKDDRWALDEMTAGGKSVLAEKPWGTIESIGRIELPTTAFTQHLKGREFHVKLRFNAAYRPADLEFFTEETTIKCLDLSTCSTPTLAVVTTGDSIVLAVGDSGDVADSACDAATVKMVGGRYSFDEVTVEVGQKAVFPFAPIGREISFEAVGSNAGGATSAKLATATAPAAAAKAILIDSIADGSRWSLSYGKWSDAGPNVTAQADFDTVKLAGRRRPSAFYGTGGSTSVSFGGYVLNDSAESFEAMADAGNVVCRFPDGRRYAIAPKVSLSYSNPAVVRVGISGDEVQA